MITSGIEVATRTGAARTVGGRPISEIRFPRMGTSLAVTAAVLASTAPSLLPRSAQTQAVFTGTLVAVALTVAWAVRTTIRPRHCSSRRLRAATACFASVATIAGLYSNLLWQNSLRSAMHTDTVSWRYPVDIAGGALCIALVLCGCGLAVRQTCTALGTRRTTVVIAVAVLLGSIVVAPSARSAMLAAYSASNSAAEAGTVAPTSTTRSGGTGSLVPWHTLGREGRKFVSGGTDSQTVRSYVGLESAPTSDLRVDLAVSEMVRAGAFDRAVVVVAIPTGSGWVDENAVTGAEVRFGGDVATVALQYSNKPSWATFLFAEDDARHSADALVRAVTRRAADSPSPPSVAVYGQSLGAVAGSDAYLGARGTAPHLCGAVWAGPPAGAVDTASATVLANSSDPVVRWSARLIWSPPDLAGAHRDAPMPTWLPFISFLQTSVDLVGALDMDPGHGHRYGTDQGSELPQCP